MTLHILTGDQADRATAKIREIFISLDRPDLGEQNRISHDLNEIDKALWWLADEGYYFDVEAWLSDETGSFAHDWGGILRHVEPFTGELMDCFMPRFARYEK